MRKTRLGLTLVEVLAALVLLAVISSTAWCFLRDIRFQMEAALPLGIDRAELGVAADAILKEKTLDSFLRLAAGETLTVAWPDAVTPYAQQADQSVFMGPGTTHRMLHLRRLSDSSSIPAGCWIACTVDEETTVVYRWIPLLIDEPAANPNSAGEESRP